MKSTEIKYPLPQNQSVKGNLVFAHYDKQAFEEVYNEIFEELIYDFSADSSCPFIVDAGANLGLATCFFKSRYPESTVLAFEPDYRFQPLFLRNVENNGFKNVTLRSNALAGKAGNSPFYGDLNNTTPNALGNSLKSDWGLQCPDSSSVQISTELLSPYLQRRIDLLKIDVEGAEGEVLEEAKHYLHNVKEIRMEVHQTISTPDIVEQVSQILTAAGFDITLKHRPMKDILPSEAIPWFERHQAKIHILSASRKHI